MYKFLSFSRFLLLRSSVHARRETGNGGWTESHNLKLRSRLRRVIFFSFFFLSFCLRCWERKKKRKEGKKMCYNIKYSCIFRTNDQRELAIRENTIHRRGIITSPFSFLPPSISVIQVSRFRSRLFLMYYVQLRLLRENDVRSTLTYRNVVLTRLIT